MLTEPDLAELQCGPSVNSPSQTAWMPQSPGAASLDAASLTALQSAVMAPRLHAS